MDLRQAQASGVIGRRRRKQEVVVDGSREEVRGSRLEARKDRVEYRVEARNIHWTILDDGQKSTSGAEALFEDSRPTGAAAGNKKDIEGRLDKKETNYVRKRRLNKDRSRRRILAPMAPDWMGTEKNISL